MKGITLFMWGYQTSFRLQMEYRANEIIKIVAPTLNSTTLLVGIRTKEKSDGFPVCVEPENDYLDPQIFSKCADKAEEIYNNHPDQSIFYGDEPRMRDKPLNIRKKSAYEAVKEITSIYDSDNKTISYCGMPGIVEGYYVIPILQFSRCELLEYPSLPAPITFMSYSSNVSLIECIIYRLLSEITEALEKKEPGRFFNPFNIEPSAILIDAANYFTMAIALDTHNIMFQNIFNTINLISSLHYEGSEANGKIFFSSITDGHSNIPIRFNKSIFLNNYKLVRKILEICGNDLYCICDGSNGIIGLNTITQSEQKDKFYIIFKGHYKWDLYYGEILLMKSVFGIPQLPTIPLKETVFYSNFRRIFKKTENNSEKLIWTLIEAAMEQRHGTMIVISGNAKNEAKRLAKQSMEINPIKLTPEFVKRLSSIDGAILIDDEGICYAIGVILDGMATEQGDPARGARYNSAIRYVSTTEHFTICLVISEDGYVNIIPQLQPQIKKSEIIEKIELLKKSNKENYHKIRTWLDEHRFYFTIEECEIINIELDRIDNEPRDIGEIKITTDKFVPNIIMNDTYYLIDT